jgi:hypothetical protein
MKIFLSGTSNLGDFLNGMPVLSGLQKSYGKIDLIIRPEMAKFKGIKQFLAHQNLFSDVNFANEVFVYGNITHMSSWPIREDKNDPNRPIETCRYENFMKDNYKLNFEVDDKFQIILPEMNIEVHQDAPYIGDRWSEGTVDDRRRSHTLSGLKKCHYIDYNNDLLTNAYIIKNSNHPFITSLSGVSVLADLLNKDGYVIWKAEDWDIQFRNGDDISWDNGKNINTIFEKHYYLNRKMKLLHQNKLEEILNDY